MNASRSRSCAAVSTPGCLGQRWSPRRTLGFFARSRRSVLREADAEIPDVANSAQLRFQMPLGIHHEPAPHHAEILRSQILELRPFGPNDDRIGFAKCIMDRI